MVELIPSTPGSLSVEHLERTLGVFFIGFMFAMILYGYTIFQSYLYYCRYPKDPLALKSVVVLLFCTDSAVSVLLSRTLYYHSVDLFPFTVGIEFASSTYSAQLVLVSVAIFISQIFYASRVWSASKNLFVTGAIAIFATGGFVLGIVMAVQLFQDNDFSHLANNTNKTVAAICYGARAASGLLTLCTLSIGPQPSDLPPPKDWFDKMVLYAISRSGAAVFVQFVLIFIFIGSPENIYWIPFHDVATKLFVISAITLLNSRVLDKMQNYDEPSWDSSTNRTIGNSMGNVVGSKTGIEFRAPVVRVEVAKTTLQDSDRSNYDFKPEQGL